MAPNDGLTPALAAVLANLRCPVCARPLAASAERVVACSSGHRFDVARQGYLNLAVGAAGANTGDTGEMVQARDRFLAGDHYAPIARAVTAAAGEGDGLVADVGGGTGYYLAAVLDATPERRGVNLDRSAAALRRAARTHPRAAAVGADVWRALPLTDRCVDVLLDVFAPRNGAEMRRVLAPAGRVVVVTPRPDHLHEIVAPLGMVRVDETKAERVAASLGGLVPSAHEIVEHALELDRKVLRDLVLMGPTGHHTSAHDVEVRMRDLPEPMRVTVSVDVTTLTHPAPTR